MKFERKIRKIRFIVPIDANFDYFIALLTQIHIIIFLEQQIAKQFFFEKFVVVLRRLKFSPIFPDFLAKIHEYCE